MIHTNKIRRILRAKNGSQIPKFLSGGSPWETAYQLYTDYFITPSEEISLNNLNPATIGSQIPTSNVDYKLIQSPTTLQFKQLTYGDPKLTGFDDLNKENLTTKKYEKSLKMSGFKVPELTRPNTEFTSRSQLDKDIRSAKWLNLKNNVGNFISKNSALVGMGLDYLGNLFNDTVNSNTFDNVTGGLDAASNLVGTVNPQMGLALKGASTVAKIVNSIGGKKSDNFSSDKWTLSLVGGSYGGSVATINNAQSKAGQKYGLFNNSSRKKANRLIAEAKRQLGIMTDIAEEASDQKALAGNDLNYIQYNMDINGGYDLRYIRAAKSGMKLSDKISLIKSRKYVDHYIDLNSKLVEEFAKGGTLDWEPVIEVFEPVIEISEFLKGGLIEELYDFSQESEDYPQEYKDFKNSLPKNQRLTPESEYRTYLYWQLWGKPKNFQYTLNHPDEDGNYMYTWDNSDRSYHGNSIAWKDGMGYFIKPKDHPTLKYELDYYNKGLITEEGGKQRPAKGQELKGWLNFKNNYDLVEDGNFYKYVPKLTRKNEWEPTIEILDTHTVGLPEYKSGGKTLQELKTPEIEETTQKNIIPEGALHKNKHHIEHTEGLTKKGIPVVDNEGNLQAEVEKEEIIFSLEVTKKLEELYKDYYDSDKSLKEKDEAAIEAGKLLVYQILFNTDDRTGLIKRCEEGGKL